MTKQNSNIKKEFLDKQVSAFSEGIKQDDLLLRHKKIIELITKHSNKNDYILDVGCFDGKILKQLEKIGYKNLYGVDFAKAAENSFINTNIKFLPIDIENEPIPFNKSFDVIIFSDVLEHLFSPQTMLFDIRKRLTKKGKVIFSVPNAGWIFNGFLLTFLPSKLFLSTAFGPWGHTYQFTFYQVKKTANNLYYKVLDLEGGKMDNYAFKSGAKKFLFNLFININYLLTRLSARLFSAHIFGVIQNTDQKADKKYRFELGA